MRRSQSMQRGYTYLAMLFAVATVGAVVASGSVVWQHEAQRQRETELLRIGNEFRQAIGLYYHRSPGSVKRYPGSLDELLRDDRHLSLQRYLRRIHRDPITGKTEWGLVNAPEGGIMGVYSRSEQSTVKRSGFEPPNAAFSDKTSYSEWKFVYTAPDAASAPEAGGTPDIARERGRKGGREQNGLRRTPGP
jgi:type II secretory pathway pseudopilin PulG